VFCESVSAALYLKVEQPPLVEEPGSSDLFHIVQENYMKQEEDSLYLMMLVGVRDSMRVVVALELA
jgi:hypothetical protein